jgi:hypothetical protein
MSVTDHSPEPAPFTPLPGRRPTSANGDHRGTQAAPPYGERGQDGPPQRAGAESGLPQRGPADPGLPQRGSAEPGLPQRGAAEPLPRRGGGEPGLPRRFPSAAGAGASTAPAGATEGMLPRRSQRGRPRRVGRHRSTHRISVASDAPALVLAVPGRGDAMAALAGRIADAATESCPGVQIRVGFLDAGAETLAELLGSDAGTPEASGGFGDFADLNPRSRRGRRAASTPSGQDGQPAPSLQGRAPEAVVVPLLAGPHPRYDAAIAAAIGSAAGPVMLATALGPHPLLAGALHDRLHDVGLARASRALGLNIAAGATGIVVVADRGPQALADAGVTTLLLASRLAVPAAPASLGDPASIDAAVSRLREAGAAHLALSPCVIGPETDPAEFAALSAALNAPSAPPLGAHPAIAQLVAVRYGEALARIAVASR